MQIHSKHRQTNEFTSCMAVAKNKIAKNKITHAHTDIGTVYTTHDPLKEMNASKQ